MLANSVSVTYMEDPKNPQTPLGRRIQELRKDRRMSQEELGNAVGLSRGYISQIETGIQQEVNILRIGMSIGFTLQNCNVFTDERAGNCLDGVW